MTVKSAQTTAAIPHTFHRKKVKPADTKAAALTPRIDRRNGVRRNATKSATGTSTPQNKTRNMAPPFFAKTETENKQFSKAP